MMAMNFFARNLTRGQHLIKQLQMISPVTMTKTTELSSILQKYGCVQCRSVQKQSYSSSSVKNTSESETSHDSTSGSSETETPGKPEDLLAAATDSIKEEPIEFPSDAKRFVYKTEQAKKRSQSKHRFHPRVSPDETSILLFPGQGSQFVGMGKELLNYPLVEDMYVTASDILGYDLLDLCLNGPQEKLNQTVHCQPAILVTSLAAVEKLKHTRPWAIEHCVTAAGFSIGEYAALVFSGALTFEDAVRLVKVRAEAMQEASEATPGGMMTVFLSHKSKLNFACHLAKQYCRERMSIEEPVCDIANYLYPECKVIAGNQEALEFIEQNAKEFALIRTKRLPVSGAFHTPLMAPAKKSLLAAIKKVQIQTPLIPVHSNVNSYKYHNPNIVERFLAEQVFKPVRWEQTMHVMYSRPPEEAYPYTYEMGPGKQLGAILRKVNRKAQNRYEAVIV